jgi:hypothetical protein
MEEVPSSDILSLLSFSCSPIKRKCGEADHCPSLENTELDKLLPQQNHFVSDGIPQTLLTPVGVARQETYVFQGFLNEWQV